ncbi:MAG: NlpC/P60 family protein [Bacteroidota bacterium]
MVLQKQYIIIRIVLIMLIPSFIIFNTFDSFAGSKKYTSISKSKSKSKHKKNKHRKSRRSYNPGVTRGQAIEIIRNNSEIVSELAGLEPNVNEMDFVPSNAHYTDLGVVGEEGENIAELEAEDDVEVDQESFKILWLNYVDDGITDEYTAGGLNKKQVMSSIMEWLGTPYRFGARSRISTDCSAFTQSIFRESVDLSLPRTAREQFNVGMRIQNRGELQFGDLVFFHTYSRKFASHVGIYLGDDLFAHASSRYGVTVSSLESTYYNNRFIGGRRYSSTDMVRQNFHPKQKSTDEN